MENTELHICDNCGTENTESAVEYYIDQFEDDVCLCTKCQGFTYVQTQISQFTVGN
jgi:hypothetical protein